MAGVSRLLDGGPERVDLYPEVDGTDDDDNPVRLPAQTPSTSIYTRLHPLSSTEAADRSITTTAYVFSTRDFPAGAWAKVVARGREWDVLGEPGRPASSERTKHARVIIVARGPETLPGSSGG